MTETVTDLIICNRALARIGVPPLNSFDEESSKAAQVRAVYADRRDTLLGFWNWAFARRTRILDKVSAVLENGWNAGTQWGNGYRHAFKLPGDRIGAPRRISASHLNADLPLREFIIEEGRVYSNHETLFATCTVAVDPQYWPPSFRLAAIVGIATDLCVPLTHDATLAERLRVEFEGNPSDQGRGGLVGKAIAQDVSGGSPAAPMLYADELTSAHLS